MRFRRLGAIFARLGARVTARRLIVRGWVLRRALTGAVVRAWHRTIGGARKAIKVTLVWIDAHLALFVIVGLLWLVVIGVRQGKDESKTCLVQSRGLKAQRHLTNIMGDIAALLEPPESVPRSPVPRYAQGPLANLQVELPAYTALEHRQPAGRSC